MLITNQYDNMLITLQIYVVAATLLLSIKLTDAQEIEYPKRVTKQLMPSKEELANLPHQLEWTPLVYVDDDEEDDDDDDDKGVTYLPGLGPKVEEKTTTPLPPSTPIKTSASPKLTSPTTTTTTTTTTRTPRAKYPDHKSRPISIVSRDWLRPQAAQYQTASLAASTDPEASKSRSRWTWSADSLTISIAFSICMFIFIAILGLILHSYIMFRSDENQKQKKLEQPVNPYSIYGSHVQFSPGFKV